MAFVGPCVSALGLGSNVSNWLGPPAIHNRMHDRPCLRRSWARAGSVAAEAKNPPVKPPRNVRRVTAPRELTPMERAGGESPGMRSPLRHEFRRIEQRPEQVFQRLVPIADAPDVALTDDFLRRRRLAGQGAAIQGLDDLLVAAALGEHPAQHRLSAGTGVDVDE